MTDLKDQYEQFFPFQMMEIELTRPIPALKFDTHYQRAWVLGRLGTEPIGSFIVELGTRSLSPHQFGALLWTKLRRPVIERFMTAGLPPPIALTSEGLSVIPGAWPFLRSRREVLAAAPFISVIICTRNQRPKQLVSCLRHVNEQKYPRFEIIVVENAPEASHIRLKVDNSQDSVVCRYIEEPRAGLSWARNAGIEAASGEIVAFLDDDEEPDNYWLAELARGFSRGDDIGCVSGMILPARLDTQAQVRFEQIGGHSKGRGFSPAILSPYGPQSPLYPRPAFGAGGNVAFRRETLTSIGGFDVALGAGTPACAGEDTLALTLTLLNGYRIAYEPAAFVRHNHYENLDGLGRQLHGYGVGLTAFYAALLRHRPSTLPALLRLGWEAVRYLRGSSMAGQSIGQYELPRSLRRRQRWGLLAGPSAYILGVHKQIRVSSGKMTGHEEKAYSQAGHLNR